MSDSWEPGGEGDVSYRRKTVTVVKPLLSMRSLPLTMCTTV
jgi:hypothetical protein